MTAADMRYENTCPHCRNSVDNCVCDTPCQPDDAITAADNADEGLKTECCKVKCEGRFCPKCGWECRVAPLPSAAELSAEEIDAEFAAWWSSNWQRLAGIKPIHMAHEAWKHQAKRAVQAGGAVEPVAWVLIHDNGKFMEYRNIEPAPDVRKYMKEHNEAQWTPLYAPPIGAPSTLGVSEGELATVRAKTIEECANAIETMVMPRSINDLDPEDTLYFEFCEYAAKHIRALSATGGDR